MDWSPGPWLVGDAIYYADKEFVSHSMLEDFRRSVPYYHARHVLQSLPPEEPTPAMQIGSALHCLLLEAHMWDRNVAVLPGHIDRRTTEGKKEWRRWVDANRDKPIQISTEDEDLVMAMVAGIQQEPGAVELLLADGQYELPIRWTDPETGLPCKAKIDKVFPSGAAFDLKTCRDSRPEAWLREAGNFGYHRQAAHYLDGIGQALGLFGGPFYHVVVSKEPPYECAVYELDEDAIDLGRRQNARNKSELAARLLLGEWRGRYHSRVQRGSLPRYFFWEER